jgi:hypothetical protein
VRRDRLRLSSWCWYEQRHSALIEQFLSGKRGASLDRNREPTSPNAAGQQAALLPIDTACQALRGGAGAVDCFADGDALVGRLHMNNFSIAPRARVSYKASILSSAANRQAISRKRIWMRGFTYSIVYRSRWTAALAESKLSLLPNIA